MKFTLPERLKLLQSIAQKTEDNGYRQLNLPLTYSGTVMARKFPLLENDSINIIIMIRGMDASMTGQLTSTGLNAVMIAVEAGGMASAENTAKFGSINFVNKTVDETLEYFSKMYKKPIKLNKLGIASFSGGFGALGKILEERNKSKYPISSVYNFDGMHYSKRVKDETGKMHFEADPSQLAPWKSFAEEAAKDPSKQMVVVYTAIEPGSYVGNSTTAAYLNNEIGADKYQVQSQWKSTQPLSVASKGGYAAYQLYDKNSKLPGGAQHVKSNEAKFDVFSMVAPTWNSVNAPQKPIAELEKMKPDDKAKVNNEAVKPQYQGSASKSQTESSGQESEMAQLIADIAKSII